MRDSTAIKVKLVLIRHGQTEGNREGRYIGIRSDESLTEEARAFLTKAREQGLYQCAEKPDFVISSPMRRCLETASILFSGEVAAFPVISDFAEIDFGEFEGENYQSLNGRPDYQAWIDSGGKLAFPGGESREAFIERTMQGFSKLLKLFGHTPNAENCKAAAVVHGGTIMAIMSSLTELDYYDAQVENGGAYILNFILDRGDIREISYDRLPAGIYH